MAEDTLFEWNMLDKNLTHVLEFGVATGNSFNWHVRFINEAFPDNRYIVRGFDTFTGLPEDWVSQIDEQSRIVIRKGGFDQGGNIPVVFDDVKEKNDVDFYVGLFEDTIPQYIEKEAQPIAFLHIDCDLYSSAKTVLYSLNDYIVPGTIIRFDEWVYWHDLKYNDHEQRAFYEWVSDFNIKYEFFKEDLNNIEQKFVLITG